MNAKICEAIKLKRVVEFSYEGGMKAAEPFCYGLNSKNKDVLRAYQIESDITSVKSEGWKDFIVSKMSNLKIADKTFTGNRFGYNAKDKNMVESYCKI